MRFFCKRRIAFGAVLAAYFLASAAFAESKSERIDSLMTAYHKNGGFNGAILVAEKGEVVFRGGFGDANMEWGVPNTADTKFRLASITKQFTSMLIMQLVEKGKLSLDGKLADYLDYYRKDVGEKVTIRQLLNHTSGIPSYTGSADFMQNKVRDPYAPEEFVKKYCSDDLEFEPGSKFKYNNSGYFVLGAIIETVTGGKYEDALREMIFEPLGMKNSGYDHHGRLTARRASGYHRNQQGEFINAPYLDMSIPYAAGSLYSTVEDLYLWDQALYTEKLISEASKREMFTPELSNYAFGWGVRKMPSPNGGSDSLKVTAHSGGIFGFNTIIFRFVEERHLIVMLRNAPGAKVALANFANRSH